jgi:hypothetical protein
MVQLTVPTTVAEWRVFLLAHSIEFLHSDLLREAVEDGRAEWMVNDAQREAGWLGFEPAPDEAIQAAERRLGVELPLTYRSFLRVSNGWSSMAGEVDLLAVEEVDWFTKLDPVILEHWSAPGMERFADKVETFERCVLVSAVEDGDYWLLDPGLVEDGGEWVAYEWHAGDGTDPERYVSFGALLMSRSASCC